MSNFDFSIYAAQDDDTSADDNRSDPKETGFDFSMYESKAKEDEEVSDYGLSGKLKKADLKGGTNATKIRQYMIDRVGRKYSFNGDIDNDQLVEDFVDRMRGFNSNSLDTAMEVRFITKANDDVKARAGEAYKLYDQLGSVFVNDGLMGAIDGVKDYVIDAALDPTNYVGVLTGGLAKVGAVGVFQSGKQLVKKAAMEAGKRAVSSGATKEAADKVAKEAAERVIGKLVEAGAKKPQRRKIVEEVARREKDLFLLATAKKARKDFMDKRTDKYIKRSLVGTTAIDGTLAALNDVAIQNVLIEADAQAKFNTLQTALSFGLGSIGAGVQLGGMVLGKAVKPTQEMSVADSVYIGQERAKLAQKEALGTDVKSTRAAAKQMKKDLKTWRQKVDRGESLFGDMGAPAEALKVIMLGIDGKGETGGLVKLFRDRGMKLDKDFRVTDLLTNVTQFMKPQELAEINELLPPGMSIGDVSAIAPVSGPNNISDNLAGLVAKTASDAGQILNVLSQSRKMIDTGVLRSDDLLTDQVTDILAKEELGKETPRRLAYAQGVWKRLLVSSPATTAVNVAGWSQFAVGQTLADALQSGSFMALGAMTGNKELYRKGKVYGQMIAARAGYLLDARTTHDNYMQYLLTDPKIAKVLNETMSGGVEKTADRFGIDATSTGFKTAETVSRAAATLTGVRIQDTFTKSQMFMTELDKYLRLKKDKSLKDVLNDGDIDLIDDSVLGSALDTTLKSVFSKDYTTDDQLLSQAAKFTESISNIPLLGTVLPFGRFFNNVIATSYQWSVGGAVEVMSAIAKAEKRNIETVEAASRSLVGITAWGMAMHYDEERRKKNLGTFEIDAGSGTIVDAKNTYPFSLWLAAGRVGNLRRRGEEVPTELTKELTEQLAVGQLASDVQFGNDLTRIVDSFLNQDITASKASLDAISKMTGNYFAGFTRPLDAVNKLTGFITDTDVAKDVRQAEGSGEIFTQAATKYFDNVIEAFTDKADSVTGEELRVATRQGKIQDANPMARIFGVTVKPGRTATEKVYSMAQMQPWTANERSQIAAYDKVFNETLAPVLERATDKLLRDPKFSNADLTGKRAMLKSTLSDVKTRVRKSLQKYAAPEKRMLAIKRKASSHGNKELRNKALDAMRDRFNFRGTVEDMSYSELQFFMDYVDYLKDIYE